MEAIVRTGSTKAPRDTHQVALSLTSEHDEAVCVLMDIIGKPKEAKVFERECIALIERSLLQAEGEVTARFDSTLKELNGLLKGFFVSRAIQDAHMVIAIADPRHMIHVSHAGRAEAYLVRSGLASQITEYTPRKSTPAFVHISSGQAEERDTVVLSSQRLLRTLTPAQLAQLAQHENELVAQLSQALESDGEHAVVGMIFMPGKGSAKASFGKSARTRKGKKSSGFSLNIPTAGFLSTISESVTTFTRTISDGGIQAIASVFSSGNKKERQRMHLFLLAGALAALVIVWATVHLFTSSQRSKSRSELEELVNQVNTDLQTAESRRLIGDTDAANTILQRAEERAEQVMASESGLFRMEALDLLDRIRTKSEEINNIVRLSPRVVANMSAKTPDITAQGLIGISDGELFVYDRQDLTRVIQNSIETPVRLTEDELLLTGTNFDRYQTQAFLTTGNSVVEVINNEPVSMKTEDPAGWVRGKDIEAYLRYMYVLSPENKQIYKYERLSNRYGVPVEYNVNGDLTGALDMAIDGNVYVLKDDGTVLKLYRGEVQPFMIRRAPEDAFATVTKMFKALDGNFYFLDPENARVLVTSDGGASGESFYVRQYMLEGEQVGELKDLYVDPDAAHLYVLDEKRIYVIDLGTQ